MACGASESARTVKRRLLMGAMIDSTSMEIRHWKKVAGLGFLSWLIPFAFSVAVFPVKQRSPALFDTLMSIALIATAAVLGRRYFRGRDARLADALIVGLAWVACNLVCDYPLFAYGPMQMTAARYYSEIGSGYLLYPLFLASAVWVLAKPEPIP